MKIRRDKITIKRLLEDKKRELKLTLVCGAEGVEKVIKTNFPSCPGLLLSGFKEHFKGDAVQILGPQEMGFLYQIKEDELKKSIKLLVSFNVPCIIISGGLRIPDFLIGCCKQKKIPLLQSKLKRRDLIHLILDYLEIKTAPYIYVHGTLVDVYGVGILFTGKSGIGKSETALDLVARGHRLVADDVIKIVRRTPGILMGQGKEPINFFHSHIEIRGIGVIDLSRIFGVRATRLHKRIEVEVNLLKWGEKTEVERTGLDEKTKTILGVKLPFKVIPLVLGKNISVLSEMVALNYLLKIYAYDTSRIFNKRLLDILKKKGEEFAQLDKDLE